MKLIKQYLARRADKKEAFDKLCEQLKDEITSGADARDEVTNEYRRKSNNTCENCGSTQNVEKFADINGRGKVDGDFYLGFGSVHGKSSVKTSKVCECSECGNQWKPQKMKYESNRTQIEDFCYSMSDRGIDTRKCMLKKDSLYPKGKKLLKKYPAEVVCHIFNEYRHSFNWKTNVKQIIKCGWWEGK